MKFTLKLDPECEEQVVVYARQPSALTEAIADLVREQLFDWIGYIDREGVRLELDKIFCFAVEDGKVYALTETGRFQMHARLYQLEEHLPPHFVKLHQSCIGNLKRVRRFDASLAGALKVTFENGHVEYVSRRQLKTVKERLGVR